MKILALLRKNTYMTAACGSNKGKLREKNEDNFCFAGKTMETAGPGRKDGTVTLSAKVSKNGKNGNGTLFAVFDGVGGTEHGELASRCAAAWTRSFMDDHGTEEFEDVETMLGCLCQELNRKVYGMTVDGPVSKACTTFASLYFNDGTVWSCNVGDSRCYRFSNGILEMMSLDHGEDMFSMEKIGRNRKPSLIQYLGMDPDEGEIEPCINSAKVSKGDAFLVCSDGLTDMVAEPDIAGVLRKTDSAESAVRELIRMALQNGGKDNVSVIVCR